MTPTAPEVVIRALVLEPTLRGFVEVVTVVCLVALLLEREMVRHRPGSWSKTASRYLTSLTVPLTAAWVIIAARRFLELAGA